MNLVNNILKNTKLKFLDAETGEIISVENIFNLPLPAEFDSTSKVVFLYIDNSLKSIRLYFSLLSSSHTLVLLNPELNSNLKEELERTYQPYVIYDTSNNKRIGNYVEFNFNEYKYWISRESNQKIQVDKRIKLLLSTSGTTGSAKFVKLSEYNLFANSESITNFLPIRNDDVIPLNLPIFYSYGLSVLHSNSMKVSSIVCTQKNILDSLFWEDLKRFGYTSLSGVPFTYEMLKRIGFTKREYPSLRYLTQAGGKLANHLIEEFAKYCNDRGLQFFVMYGQTEATARMSYLHPDYTLEKLGSIGKPIPNGRFVIDELTGELIYHGPNIFGGYAQSLQDLSAFEQPNELRTGDLAKKDEDGFYYIVGRAKRFIKLFGTRTNLDEVEELLKNHFQQLQFACTGKDDKLLIAYNPKLHPEAEIKTFIKETLNIHPTVVQIIPFSELPKTANGKVDYTSIISKI